LIYSFDEKEPVKRQRAIAVLASLGDRMVISTQVLQEFFWTATNKLALNPMVARNAVEAYIQGEVVSTSPRLVAEAIDVSILNRIAIWDALVVQAALTGRCERILTEDLNHGQLIKGVRIENPFL
jgi:predicted nucleic acid-binding protein